MPMKSYRAALNEAMAGEMRRDPSVIVMGEDVSGGTGAPGEDDAWGGPLGVTKGLHTEFGPTAWCWTRRSRKAGSSARRPALR